MAYIRVKEWGLQIPRVKRSNFFLTADCKSAGTPSGRLSDWKPLKWQKWDNAMYRFRWNGYLTHEKSFFSKKVSKTHFCIKSKAIHLTNNILRQWYFLFLFTRSIIEVSLKYHKTSIESSSKHNKGSEDIKHINDIPPSTNIWTLYAHRLGTQWTKPGWLILI